MAHTFGQYLLKGIYSISLCRTEIEKQQLETEGKIWLVLNQTPGLLLQEMGTPVWITVSALLVLAQVMSGLFVAGRIKVEFNWNRDKIDILTSLVRPRKTV